MNKAFQKYGVDSIEGYLNTIMTLEEEKNLSSILEDYDKNKAILENRIVDFNLESYNTASVVKLRNS